MPEVSTQITDAIAQNHSSEFTQLIQEVSFAVNTLTQDMAAQNTVFINFCNEEMAAALDVAKGISEIEQSAKKKSSANIKKAKEMASMNIEDKADKVQKTIDASLQKNNAATPTVDNSDNQQAAYDTLKMAFAAKYLESVSNLINNQVTAQQQSYVTAQAATTMGIATIYSSLGD